MYTTISVSGVKIKLMHLGNGYAINIHLIIELLYSIALLTCIIS